MNIARFAVTRPVAVTMQIASLVLLGAVCATRLPVDLLPQVSLSSISVVTNWPNTAPEEIETQITRPVEEAVSSAPGVDNVTSTSSQGSSFVRIQFKWGTDIGQAAVDILQMVQRAIPRFPKDPTLQTPTIFKFDPSQSPILIYGVSGENDPVKLRSMLDNQVVPLLESAGGVASATASGGEQRAVMVNVDPTRLRAHHLSLSEVGRRIVEENVNLPAGIAQHSETEYTIRSLGWFKSTKDIASVPISTVEGRQITLGDVATVTDSHQDRRLYTRLNGEPAAGIVITKQSGVNTVETAKAVQEKLREVGRLYPNLEFKLAYDQAQFIENSVNDVKTSALIGGVLAVLILLFFLRNIRSTLVVALSIPISIISTFALIYLCGFTLNTMTLSGLALATGLIVDDAVVILENIFRHIERDKKRAPDAAVEGTNEIATAVLSSTLTVMVVFLPLLLIKGQAGALYLQFGLVVIFSIAVSLLDAMTVVPMLASRMIQGEAHGEETARKHGWIDRQFHKWSLWLAALDQSYRNALRWTLKHRWQVVIGAFAITASSALLMPYIGRETLPQTDSGDFQVQVKMPIGTSLDQTNKAMLQVESIINANPNVQTAFSAAGGSIGGRGGARGGSANTGSVTVKLKHDRTQTTAEVVKQMQRQLAVVAGARVRVSPYDVVSQIITGGNPSVDINIFGGDITTLTSISRDVMDKMRSVPGYENVDTNWQEATPEMQWQVNREKASALGLSFTDIAQTIDTATNGDLTGYYHESGFQYPIYVQLPRDQRLTVNDLSNLVVKSGGGPGRGDILLGQVAKPTYAFGPSQITRQNRQRYISVSGQPQGRSTGDVQKDIEKVMEDVKMPSGYYWQWGRSIQRQAEEFSGMGLAIILAIGLIYMILASQFESFVHPLTILVSVPLCGIGVVLALFLTNRAFGLTAFIGLLLLVGIVVKNGILLVDYTNLLRARGRPRDEAILEAAPTRLRPILMTASAALLGMLPLALGFGEGSETQAPLATAVAGGLVTSTFLTLFVVPAVYTLFDDAGRFFRKDRLDLAAPELVEPSVAALGGSSD